MTHSIKTADDVRWLLTHTQGFRGGHVMDVHLAKRWIFDEETGRDVSAGRIVTVAVRYHLQGILRIAKLTLQGVSDFSIFEQDGVDGTVLGMIQVEVHEGLLRFWFDPQGNLYVVCEEAVLEEVSLPHSDVDMHPGAAAWIFQAKSGDPPTVDWLLNQLDQAGVPCIWKSTPRRTGNRGACCWEGELMSTAEVDAGCAAALTVRAYEPIDGAGFGMRLQSRLATGRTSGRLLRAVAEVVTQRYPGTCLTGERVVSSEW
ncbi:MAG: hypothetical protein ABS70_07465 [Nitrospira sp. SCN 59-13]|nr:MAG: hypothetical protein ABS70_07465 [Nitrospira sp. SCN 59-13]